MSNPGQLFGQPPTKLVVHGVRDNPRAQLEFDVEIRAPLANFHKKARQAWLTGVAPAQYSHQVIGRGWSARYQNIQGQEIITVIAPNRKLAPQSIPVDFLDFELDIDWLNGDPGHGYAIVSVYVRGLDQTNISSTKLPPGVATTEPRYTHFDRRRLYIHSIGENRARGYLDLRGFPVTGAAVLDFWVGHSNTVSTFVYSYSNTAGYAVRTTYSSPDLDACNILSLNMSQVTPWFPEFAGYTQHPYGVGLDSAGSLGGGTGVYWVGPPFPYAGYETDTWVDGATYAEGIGQLDSYGPIDQTEYYPWGAIKSRRRRGFLFNQLPGGARPYFPPSRPNWQGLSYIPVGGFSPTSDPAITVGWDASFVVQDIKEIYIPGGGYDVVGVPALMDVRALAHRGGRELVETAPLPRLRAGLAVPSWNTVDREDPVDVPHHFDSTFLGSMSVVRATGAVGFSLP